MFYGQKNYPQHLGNSPVQTIASEGCLLTADANLLTRWGETIDPVTLNNYFVSAGVYTYDNVDRADDDLNWSSISRYDGNVQLKDVGGASLPTSNDAIVRFHYNSVNTGQPIDHYCLVDHVDGDQLFIIDSYDGLTKGPGAYESVYHKPTGWATYVKNAPAPPPKPYYIVLPPDFTPKTVELKQEAVKWDCNYPDLASMEGHILGTQEAGLQFSASGLLHHNSTGQDYYLPDANTPQGYLVTDCQDYVPPAPTIYTTETIDGITYTAFDSPRQMYVNIPAGVEKWKLSGVQTWRDFTSVEHSDYGASIYVVGQATLQIPPSGADYYMVANDFGDFKNTGKVANAYGYSISDLSPTKPAPIVIPPAVVEPPTPEPEAATPEAEAPPTESQPEWVSSYRAFIDKNGKETPVKYVIMKPYSMKDVAGVNKPANLITHYSILISGTFHVGTTIYGLPTVGAILTPIKWYGVPMLTGDQAIIQKEDDVFNSTVSRIEKKALNTVKPIDKLILSIESLRQIGAKLDRVLAQIKKKK